MKMLTIVPALVCEGGILFMMHSAAARGRGLGSAAAAQQMFRAPEWG